MLIICLCDGSNTLQTSLHITANRERSSSSGSSCGSTSLNCFTFKPGEEEEVWGGETAVFVTSCLCVGGYRRKWPLHTWTSMVLACLRSLHYAEQTDWMMVTEEINSDYFDQYCDHNYSSSFSCFNLLNSDWHAAFRRFFRRLRGR